MWLQKPLAFCRPTRRASLGLAGERRKTKKNNKENVPDFFSKSTSIMDFFSVVRSCFVEVEMVVNGMGKVDYIEVFSSRLVSANR